MDKHDISLPALIKYGRPRTKNSLETKVLSGKIKYDFNLNCHALLGRIQQIFASHDSHYHITQGQKLGRKQTVDKVVQVGKHHARKRTVDKSFQVGTYHARKQTVDKSVQVGLQHATKYTVDKSFGLHHVPKQTVDRSFQMGRHLARKQTADKSFQVDIHHVERNSSDEQDTDSIRTNAAQDCKESGVLTLAVQRQVSFRRFCPISIQNIFVCVVLFAIFSAVSLFVLTSWYMVCTVQQRVCPNKQRWQYLSTLSITTLSNGRHPFRYESALPNRGHWCFTG